jgi:DNA-directed RNA polymerase specialized sigma subunit
MARSCNSSSRLSLDSLPSAFRRTIPTGNQGATLWNQYQESGATADFHAITERYAPLAVYEARRLKAYRSVFVHSNLDDMIGDGMIGLATFVTGQSHRSAALFLFSIRRAIRGAIYRAERKRQGRPAFDSRKKNPADWLAGVRRNFVKQNGRFPTREELAKIFEASIDNPAIEFRDRPSCNNLSDLADDAKVDNLCPSIEPPDQTLLDREVMRIAKKKLHGEDLKVLRLALAGHAPSEIAKMINRNQSGVHRRLNGIFWMIRANVELAAYLEVEPVAELPKGKRRYWPNIHDLPPARKIA